MRRRRVQHKAHRHQHRARDERQKRKGHVGVIDAPSPMAARMLLAWAEDAVGAAGEDEDAADSRRCDDEVDVGRKGHHCQ